MAISPRGERCSSPMATIMWLCTCRQCSAKGSKRRPAAVKVTLPPSRSKRRAPASFSSERICAEIAGWVTPSFSAAREKLFNRLTSRKVLSCSKSMYEKSPGYGWGCDLWLFIELITRRRWKFQHKGAGALGGRLRFSECCACSVVTAHAVYSAYTWCGGRAEENIRIRG